MRATWVARGDAQRRHLLTGDEALLWAERTGGTVQMADVTEVAPAKARRLLAEVPDDVLRCELLGSIKVVVKA